MHIIHINGVDLNPSIFGYMVQIVDTSRHGIAMTRVVDCSFTKIDCLFDGKIGSVIGVQDTIGVG